MFLRKLSPLLVLLLVGLLGAGTASAADRDYNDVDAEFTRMMIPHHHQAIVMSELAPDRAADPELKSLAERISIEQSLEIRMMRGWQERNGLPVTDPESAYQDVLADPEMLERMGMATREEMDRLAKLSGAEFDRMFLDLMIPHHEGAVVMLRDVILNGSDRELNQMCQDMMSTQKAQIVIMRDMRRSV
ncbi:Uncharacterized conserved protein, DUF305 family [Actinopolyspora xinjiangensis]|uniref:Uncharacterized conserved protein, DUF305 family n=1 Tax=Actinopolyspora xinjiangensis TaxID=405564 RepID=A0A1H0W0D9_9ACTN|nr:DUF305 domain-containing protein [Actinopolyspora xinjiangensis]SDP84227.1 Uncharacterized conserved protein, DUF305 family [Actinopolyspora xinjiangensis]